MGLHAFAAREACVLAGFEGREQLIRFFPHPPAQQSGPSLAPFFVWHSVEVSEVYPAATSVPVALPFALPRWPLSFPFLFPLFAIVMRDWGSSCRFFLGLTGGQQIVTLYKWGAECRRSTSEPNRGLGFSVFFFSEVGEMRTCGYIEFGSYLTCPAQPPESKRRGVQCRIELRPWNSKAQRMFKVIRRQLLFPNAIVVPFVLFQKCPAPNRARLYNHGPCSNCFGGINPLKKFKTIWIGAPLPKW